MPTTIQPNDIHRLFDQSTVHHVRCYVVRITDSFGLFITRKYWRHVCIAKFSSMNPCAIIAHIEWKRKAYNLIRSSTNCFSSIFFFLFSWYFMCSQLVNSLGFQAIVFVLSYIFMLLFENPFIRLGKLLQGKWSWNGICLLFHKK